MDSLEWEVFKRTGNVKHYLAMKQHEKEHQAHLEAFGNEEVFDD